MKTNDSGSDRKHEKSGGKSQCPSREMKDRMKVVAQTPVKVVLQQVIDKIYKL